MTARFEFVPAARARELIGHVLEPLVSDMYKLPKNTWVRPITDEMRAVVQLCALKGAQYDIVYGVCCTWVPVATGRTAYTWPRTMRQTTRHLWVDHFTVDAEQRQWISTSEGEWVLRRQAQLALQQVLERAPDWWDSVSTVEGVLAEAQRQASNTFDIHSPSARLVTAFTLARLGDLPAAHAELGTVEPDQASELQALLGEVPVPGRSS